ncbi:MAG: hypothetical protein HY794_13760 [Desulfarculus sp.]|nr:hypothetical protein [Desulfarculus sp.]
MPAPLAAAVGLLSALVLSACAASGVPTPVPGAPFGAPPASAPGQSYGVPWVFLGGLSLGALLASLWRRRRLGQALRQPGGRLTPGEVGRLRAALAILEETILTAGRRVVVVRLKDWLRAKARGPGGGL